METKKASKILAVALSFAVTVVYGCGGGGGGGGGGAEQPAQISSPQQAASAATSMTSAMSMTAGMGAMLSGLADTSSFGASKLKSADTSDLAKLDPRLKETFDRMATQLKAPVITNAVKKAKSLATSMAAPGYNACDSGSYNLTVTPNTSDPAFTDTTYTYVFNTCRYTLSAEEWTGTLTIRERQAVDNSSSGTTITANNFTSISYIDSTFSVRNMSNVLNATFSNVTNHAAMSDSGTFSASGSFVFTMYDAVNGNVVMTFGLNNLRDDWSKTYTDSNKWTHLEDIDTLNGGVTFTVAYAFNSAGFSLSCANFENKWYYDNDLIETEREWVNGRIAIHWTPDVPECFEGIFDFTTDAATPLSYTNADYWYCPISGTLKVNNATIVFGSPINVYINNGLAGTFYSCDEIENSSMACSAPTM